jgi:hypothetical protein
MPKEPVRPFRINKQLKIIILAFSILGLFSCGLMLSIPRFPKEQEKNTLEESPAGTTTDEKNIGLLDFSNEQTLDNLSDRDFTDILAKEAIGAIDPAEIHAIGRYLVARVLSRGSSLERRMQSILPKNSEVLAMLARDRDLDDYIEYATMDGASGQYYQTVVDLVPQMKPLRGHYEKLYSGIFEEMHVNGLIEDPLATYPLAGEYRSGVTLPRLSTKPRESEYDLSHTYALDIFLRDVVRNSHTGVEKGPVIFSLSDGLVVSVDSSWSGGEDLSNYRNGGITPKAGNGAIIYSSRLGRFFLYFHLQTVFLKKGDAIQSGQPIGYGGNTGTNARKPGHGEHLHLEIYDSKSASFLKNKEIARFVFGR